ncbi:MAG: RHS repeat domain-containing protein, partial [Polaribacter sp.]
IKNKNAAVAITAKTDYYPGGMPMPNRQIVGGETYRYGYQGEYSEKDEETGLNDFQLRMYDSRINRWISPDPMGEFFSPYLAMGNNWANTTDPTGGCTDCSKCPDACGKLGIESIPDGQSIDYNFDADSYSLINGMSSFLDEVVVTGFSQGFKNTLSTTTTLFGVAQGATEQLTNSKSVLKAASENKFLTKALNSNNVLRAYQVGAGGIPKFKGNGSVSYDEVLNAANKFKVKAGTLKVLKGTGVLAGVIGTGLSIHDIGTNGLNIENGSDAVVGVIGFVPGYGWIVVGVYYLAVKPLAREGNKAYEWLINNVRIPTDGRSIMNGFRN